MKKLLGIVVLGLFWCNIGLSKVYNLKCNHIYETSWQINAIVDLKNNNVILSDTNVDKFLIREKESMLMDSDIITDVVAVKHSKGSQRSTKNMFYSRISMDIVLFERLSTSVVYMTKVQNYGMSLFVDKKKNELIFMPNDETIKDINDNKDFSVSSPNSYSGNASFFKCREI
tara:strand:+ start:15 stop:530 length:516 start_codon:yes stop_codon:yes gene_type:complete